MSTQSGDFFVTRWFEQFSFFVGRPMSERTSPYRIRSKLLVRRRATCCQRLKTLRVHPLIANMLASLGDVPPGQDLFVEDIRMTNALLLRLLDVLGSSQFSEEVSENLLEIFEYAAKSAKIGPELCKRLIYLFVKNLERPQCLAALKTLAERREGDFKSVVLEMQAKGISLIELIDIFVTDNIEILSDALEIGAVISTMPNMEPSTKRWLSSVMSMFSDLDESDKLLCLGFFESFLRNADMCTYILRDDALEDVITCEMEVPTAERVISWILAIGGVVKLRKGIVKLALKSFKELIGQSEVILMRFSQLASLGLQLWPALFKRFIVKHQILKDLSASKSVKPAAREARAELFVMCCAQSTEEELAGYGCPDFLFDVCFLLSKETSIDNRILNEFLLRFTEFMARCPEKVDMSGIVNESELKDQPIRNDVEVIAKTLIIRPDQSSHTIAI